ncbi:hypothetical protein [Paenibacillus puerhi]|uniref:hypothetical protein n=1 Tax=Paenibacillus puerhi TaxID=2692622 RepID=UPI001357C9F7|nr:hypothetical protein [Paenibacillus puerhi]
MKKLKLMGIGVLALLIITLIFHNFYKDKSQEIKSKMGFQLIANDIIQLEGAIMFQIENNWSDPNNVLEKIEDVIESIYITQEVTSKLNILADKDKEVFSRLSSFFEGFPKYSGFPNNKINDKEIQMFEELREDLRVVGWGMNISYSSDWNEFTEKVNKLMDSRYSKTRREHLFRT